MPVTSIESSAFSWATAWMHCRCCDRWGWVGRAMGCRNGCNTQNSNMADATVGNFKIGRTCGQEIQKRSHRWSEFSRQLSAVKCTSKISPSCLLCQHSLSHHLRQDQLKPACIFCPSCGNDHNGHASDGQLRLQKQTHLLTSLPPWLKNDSALFR